VTLAADVVSPMAASADNQNDWQRFTGWSRDTVSAAANTDESSKPSIRAL
jgi:hypothetical protein